MYAMTDDAAMVRVTGEQYLDQFDRAYCMAAAHIAAGDVNAAVDAVDAALEAGLSLHTFYAHPHLGGLLRSDDFAAFRARHAEPKSEPAEGESASSATVDAQAA